MQIKHSQFARLMLFFILKLTYDITVLFLKTNVLYIKKTKKKKKKKWYIFTIMLHI